MPTPKYHIYIEYAEPEKGGFRFNITEEELRRTFSEPFNEGKPFWLLGRLLNPIKVKKALIFWSYDEANLLDLPNDERVVSAKDKKYLIDCLQKSKVKGAYVCTDKFLNRHQAVAAPVAAGTGKRRVLIVSGADKEMRTALTTALTKLLLVPVMLSEEPGNGKKIIERFNDYNDIGLVVVLLSPDDYAYPSKAEGSKRKLQPRRDVTFELAYLTGRMGPEKVLAFYRETPNFEAGTDFEGINAIPFDEEGTWKHSLLSELTGNGYVVEPDRILK